MAYCANCGTELPAGSASCPRCGVAAAGTAPAAKSSRWPLWLILAPIGCVVLIAFTGIVAALLIPNFLDALHKAKAKRTVADMRVLGDAWASWATAQGLEVSGVTADWSVDFESLGAPATLEELEAQIGTDFAPIEGDGWKRPFEFRVVQSEGFATLAIRSAGRDGVWQTGLYEAGSFARAEYDQDIVWVNGDFVRWPASGSTNP